MHTTDRTVLAQASSTSSTLHRGAAERCVRAVEALLVAAEFVPSDGHDWTGRETEAPPHVSRATVLHELRAAINDARAIGIDPARVERWDAKQVELRGDLF